MAEELMHPNLSYEDMIRAEMARTGMTRAELAAANELKQAEVEATFAELLAADSA